MRAFLLVVALCCVFITLHAADVIIKPQKGFSHNVALLFAPGFGIGPDAYTPLLTKLQFLMESQQRGLWIGIPQMKGNITTFGLEKALKRVAGDMIEAGLPSDHGTLYSGHSVGGALLPYIVGKPEKLAEGFNAPDGMMLLASFLVREFRTESVPDVGPGQYQFPACKVLTVGGELDGLARVTRMAEAYYNQLGQATDPLSAARNLPVTVVEGVTHMQFASGDIPNNVMKKDLIPDVSYDAAHAAIAADMAAFISGVFGDDWGTLDARVHETGELLQPIVDALLMEGYHQFKPPCYCEAEDEYGGLEYGTCPQQPGCQANAPWTQIAQQYMAGDVEIEVAGASTTGKGLKVTAADSQHIVTEEDPSCHLPHIHSGIEGTTTTPNAQAKANPGNGKWDPLCSSPDDCTLTVSTITQLVYETGSEFDIYRESWGNDNIDSGYWPISAHEMKSKMKSRQSLWQAANNTDAVSGAASFDDLDAPEQGRCSSINAAAIEWAAAHANAKTTSRYNKYGQKMVAAGAETADKKVCIAGPCWIWNPLEYRGLHKGEEEVTVVAPTFAFGNTNPYPCDEKTADKTKALPCTAGMHYCKLLSPARAIEWMYVDGLRQHHSLASQQQGSDRVRYDDGIDKEDNEPKCCETCAEGTDKYYSIPKHHQENCGESCIAPADVPTYEKLEPGLTKADSNTPCVDHGYVNYDHTETHGEGTAVAVAVDFYQKP